MAATQANHLEGESNAHGMRLGVIATRWNEFIVDRLLEGALGALSRAGADAKDVTVATAPGAFELPVIAKTMADTGQFDAIVALGCVIRGATPHFDYVAGEAAKGLSSVALSTGVPVAFGVLTTDTIEQAIERAGTKAGNKGAEAALTAIETASLQRKLTKSND
ncbi:MAG: 6,7-dimethyl-8-ribityllumazine synthase [Pseudomonadota bacterium]